jgi:hypothetical protein
MSALIQYQIAVCLGEFSNLSKKPVWKSVASQACSKSKLKPSVSEGLNFESAHWENLFINLRTNPPILRRSASFATTNGKMSSAG